MNVPDSYPDNDTGWLDYLQDYDNALLLQMPFVPFWMQTVLGCMDLIGPETEADLERIIKRVLELPTHEHLREIRAAVRDEIAAVRGPHYFQDRTPLGRKYGVIVNLLDGHIKQPFDDCEWAACFVSYAMGCIDPDGTKEAIIGERIVAALKEYSPPKMYNPQTNVLREAILGSLIILATLCICAAVLFPVYNRVRHGLHKDWEYHKNTAAINKAMGFTITSGTKEGDYHDAGLQVLAVSPNGPSAKTGLRVGDKVKRLDYNAVKRLIVEHSGRTLVLPIERGERHFDCTIQVPKFALPFPGASY